MRKVLVANRGEIALRVIRACRELDLATVAVYSDADEGSLHARRADEAVRIGKAPAQASYLNGEALLQAAAATEADAVHPGYGFLSEDAGFAQACETAGLTWIGPSPGAIARLGDKAAARALAREAGVPTVPGSDGAVSPEQAPEVAEHTGYPVMVKAAAGGGGRGLRVVASPDELDEAVRTAAREAESAFGSGALYLERFLEGARHIEVQVLGDLHGTVVHLLERECSIQRRRQKLVEEAPSPTLDGDARQVICAAAVGLARAAGYASAGTAEFLVDGDGGFYFIEMNTRLQVEHGVTELVTGIDLVHEQLRIAAGEPISFAQEDLRPRGHAIEFRINAEDPAEDFRPGPGEVTALELPGGPGVRVDSAIEAGGQVVPFYDSLVAKLMVWAPDRTTALRRGRRALDELGVEGIPTTVALHRWLVEHEGFRTGDVDVGYLERLLADDRVREKL